MIASIPRSGSTFFTMRLWSTAACGAPLEYLNPNTNAPARRRLGGTVGEYWRELLRVRTDPSGTFSYKLFLKEYVDLAQTSPDFLKNIAPTHVVYFYRQDVIGQAISYARAIQTMRWFETASDQRAPRYDVELIAKQERSIRLQADIWGSVFQLMNIDPLVVSYEAFLDNERASLERIGAHLGCQLRPGVRAIGDMRSQRDDLSLAWRARYLEDAGRLKPAPSDGCDAPSPAWMTEV